MITNRYLQESDYELLSNSLENDEFHTTTKLEFFLEKGTVCSVYEDDKGIVLFARGRPFVFGEIKVLKLDLQFLDNKDARRNLKVMLEGFTKLEEKARENGFTIIVFESDVPILRKFCSKRLGFLEVVDNFLLKVV